MDKLHKIESKLHLLSSEQLDIIYKLIASWDIKDNEIQTDDAIVKKIYESTISPIEDPINNYSKEELLEEYGVLFYNQENTNNTDLNEISIEYNYNDTSSKQFIKNTDITANDNNNYLNTANLNKIASSTFFNSNTSNINTDDFDPLFPNTDFDSLTDLNKSKYDDLDFSALISKKPN